MYLHAPMPTIATYTALYPLNPHNRINTFASKLHIHRKIIEPSGKLAKAQQWPDMKRLPFIISITDRYITRCKIT